MRSIRSIIFNWVFFATALFFGLSVVAIYLLSSKMIYDFILEDHKRLLHHVSTNINSNVSRDLSALDRVSRYLEKKTLTQTHLETELSAFLNHGDVFTAIHVYRPDGELVTAVRRDDVAPYKPEQNIIKQSRPEVVELFRRAVDTGKPALSNLIRTKKNFYYQVYYAPLYDKNKKIAVVLTGGISPSFTNMDYLLTGMTMSEYNFIALFGQQIKVVAAAGKQRDSTLLELADTILQRDPEKAKTGIDQFDFSTSESNYVVLTEFIPKLKYWLSLSVDKRLMVERQKKILRYIFAVLCISVLFCLGLSYFLGRRLSDPFERLTSAIEQVHLGNFDHRIKYEKNDEIGYLVSLANKLAAKIKKDQYLGQFWTDEEELEKIKRGEPL